MWLVNDLLVLPLTSNIGDSRHFQENGQQYNPKDDVK